MELYRPNYDKIARANIPSIFLAGPIQGSPEWNTWLIDGLSDLDIDIFDPRRDDMDGFDYAKQVFWETSHLEKARIISFSFVSPSIDVPGRSYAQTSRFELGECLARTKHGNTGQKIVIFVEKDFPGRQYFEYKTTFEYEDIAVLSSEWDEYIKVIRNLLENGKASF